jgi:hypothetical protein
MVKTTAAGGPAWLSRQHPHSLASLAAIFSHTAVHENKNRYVFLSLWHLARRTAGRMTSLMSSASFSPRPQNSTSTDDTILCVRALLRAAAALP